MTRDNLVRLLLCCTQYVDRFYYNIIFYNSHIFRVLHRALVHATETGARKSPGLAVPPVPREVSHESYRNGHPIPTSRVFRCKRYSLC